MNHTLLVKKAMEDHLNIIHEARINMVKSFLPAGKIILDLGGANCPLYKMGYTHKFEKLTSISLKKLNIPYILTSGFPIKPSDMYDAIHFTEEGSKKFALNIASELIKFNPCNTY